MEILSLDTSLIVSAPINSSMLTFNALASLTAVDSLISFEFPYKNVFSVENGTSDSSEISLIVISFSSIYINIFLRKDDIKSLESADKFFEIFFSFSLSIVFYPPHN